MNAPATRTRTVARTIDTDRHAGTLVAVNVGMPADVAWNGRTVHTGIWKRPVQGSVMVRRLNIDGDEQGDLGGHGGENRAVLAYQLESYDHWRRHLGRDVLEWGAFGENFTITGLPDDTVCIGDRYRVGDAVLEVTQPRVTCFRVGMRLAEPDMPNLLVAHRRPGFYLRVITEGHVAAGDRIELVSRGPHALSVAETDALLYLPAPDPERVRDAIEVAALSPGWRRSFEDMLRAHEDGESTPAPPIGVEPGWSGFRDVRISRAVRESDDIVSFYLQAADAGRMPAALPGQYLTFRVPGAGEPAPVRSYSISAADATGYRISVKRDADGRVSGWLHDHLHAGDVLEAAAPRGTFTLDDDSADPVVLVSAGIGATPLLAMLHALADRASTRAVWWLHTTRDARHHAFGPEVDALLRRLPGAQRRIFYTAAEQRGGDVIAGRMDARSLGALGLPTSSTVYLCGPTGFMDAMRETFTALGISDVRTELFGSVAPLNPGVVGQVTKTPHAPGTPPGEGPFVTFARSNLGVRWSDTAFASLLELAEGCDVPTRWTCRSGVCHTCTTTALAGSVDYGIEPLVPPPAGEVLICCARPRTDLVLDL